MNDDNKSFKYEQISMSSQQRERKSQVFIEAVRNFLKIFFLVTKIWPVTTLVVIADISISLFHHFAPFSVNYLNIYDFDLGCRFIHHYLMIHNGS